MNTEQAIIKCLGSYPDIQLAILFGSVAKGRANAQSDLDIAVAGSRPLKANEKSALIEELALITGRPVDLIDLSQADGLILTEALTTGKVILRKDYIQYATLIKKMLFNNADMMPYHRRILAERRKAWIGT